MCLFRKPPYGRFRPIKAGILPSMKDMKADNKDLANRMAEIKNISTEFQNDLFNKFKRDHDALVHCTKFYVNLIPKLHNNGNIFF